MKLEDIIIEEIHRNGPLSFARFQELALYHPELGYYCSGREKLGFDGDFYTSCTLSPVFGETIAVQLLEMWQTSLPGDLTIVEYGAGTGELCSAILNFFKGQGQLPGKVHYVIIEISPALRSAQQEKLPPEVRWIGNIAEIAGFQGVVLSNELVDNLPVHRVQMRNELKEVRVDYKEGFTEVEIAAPEALRRYFQDLRVELPAGYRTEVCLAAGKWLKEVSAALHKGFVMTIDYGYLSGDLYNASRAEGTLTCYRNHKVNYRPYEFIGQQDISAHVNFSALVLFGMNNGLLLTGFREQGPFLRSLGFEKRLLERTGNEDIRAATHQQNLVLQTLLVEMGRKFKILLQHRGLEKPLLKGFEVNT